MDKTKAKTIFSILTISIYFLVADPVSAQRKNKPSWGFGGSIVYNFQTEGFGADLRVRIPVYNRLYFVPEVSYFPSFNTYHEFYAGAALHYEILTLGSYNLYLAAGGWYNGWLNADNFAPGQKKQNNIVAEAGAGFIRNRGCIRPFIENRYDFKWKEDNLRMGILIYPGACGRKKEKCPPSPT